MDGWLSSARFDDENGFLRLRDRICIYSTNRAHAGQPHVKQAQPSGGFAGMQS